MCHNVEKKRQKQLFNLENLKNGNLRGKKYLNVAHKNLATSFCYIFFFQVVC